MENKCEICKLHKAEKTRSIEGEVKKVCWICYLLSDEKIAKKIGDVEKKEKRIANEKWFRGHQKEFDF
jgi:hypothetical protein